MLLCNRNIHVSSIVAAYDLNPVLAGRKTPGHSYPASGESAKGKLERNFSDLTSELLPSLVGISSKWFLAALFIAAASAELLFINRLAISWCSD